MIVGESIRELYLCKFACYLQIGWHFSLEQSPGARLAQDPQVAACDRHASWLHLPDQGVSLFIYSQQRRQERELSQNPVPCNLTVFCTIHKPLNYLFSIKLTIRMELLVLIMIIYATLWLLLLSYASPVSSTWFNNDHLRRIRLMAWTRTIWSGRIGRSDNFR